MTRRPPRRVVVLGTMGAVPFAGTAWQVLHFVEGFRRLGYDVWYVEDTGVWPYDPEQDRVTPDCRYAVDHVSRIMARCGLGDRWAYRAAPEGGRTYGLSESRLRALFERADALVNLSGATVLRDDHLRTPVRIYLETDPVRPQIEVAKGDDGTIALLAAHTHHFTYGENLGAPDCGVPVARFTYRPTRQPVVLGWWRGGAVPADGRFTTIGNWCQTEKDIEWNGQVYTWSKHVEFLKVLDLPRRTPHPLELALASTGPEVIAMLRSHGWRVVDAVGLSRDVTSYRSYILGSRGEFTVAKDQNVRLRSGWFSDRSACYLAAGRPVITQDTGFGNILPTGRGLFAFRTVEDVLAALDAVAADYDTHRRAAEEIAAEYFAAEKVLAAVADRAGL